MNPTQLPNKELVLTNATAQVKVSLSLPRVIQFVLRTLINTWVVKLSENLSLLLLLLWTSWSELFAFS